MSQSRGPDPDPELEQERDGATGWPGSSLSLLSPKDLVLPGGKISGREKKKKSIPGCKTPSQGRRGFGNAGADGKRWKQRDKLRSN